jgi:hypothetical protein
MRSSFMRVSPGRIGPLSADYSDEDTTAARLVHFWKKTSSRHKVLCWAGLQNIISFAAELRTPLRSDPK